MNYYLLVSGILMVVMGIVHSIVGEKKIIGPIQHAEELPKVRGSIRGTKQTLRFAWHVTSVLGWGAGVILFYYATLTAFAADQIFVLKTLSVTFFICFLVSLIGSRAKHPSWIIFIIVSILTWLSFGLSN